VRGAPAVPIPDAFLPAIVSAGTRCPVITPARIAAQLMASSGFNASLVGPSGTQGIAQFRPDIWARFSTPAASAWQPLNSIAVLGQAMCTLVSEAADSGDDPYRVALAQFRAGTAQASHTGATLAAAADYVDMVVDYITVYEGDPRLSSQSTTSPASPTPARTPPRTSDPGAMPGATPGAISSTPVPPAITPKPTASTTQPPTPPAAVAIVGYVGKCIDVTDRASVDGTPLQMWTCNAASNQKWTFMADGTVRSLGKCMDVAWGSPDNGTTIQLANCSGNPAQRFTLNTAGDLVSLLVHKCVDVRDRSTANGARLQIWECAGTANQKWHRG
jgi:hypothetical protein